MEDLARECEKGKLIKSEKSGGGVIWRAKGRECAKGPGC